MANLADILRKILADQEEIYSVVGKVVSIDTEERTCDVDPLNGDARLLGVRFQASPNGDSGWVIHPGLNSMVVVTFLNKNAGFVSLCSEIDKVEVGISSVSLEMDVDGFKIERNGVNLGDTLSSLIDQIKLLTVTCAAPGSPSTIPVNVAAFDAVKTQLNQVLK